MTRPIVIIGCGGQGREIASMLLSDSSAPCDTTGEPLEVSGFIDDSPSYENILRASALGVPLLGSSDWLSDRDRSGWKFLVGIADPKIRASLAEQATAAGLESATFVHPAASVGANCRLGEGSILWPGARLTTSVTIGRQGHINQNATVGHDSVLGDYVTLNPQAAVSGNVHIEDSVSIGTSAAILQGIFIDRAAVVGAGAVVVRDVPASVVVKGVPAR